VATVTTIAAPTTVPASAPTVPPLPTIAVAAPTAVPLTTSHIGQRTKTSGCQANGALPDSACTPGAIFSDATAAQVCQSGYARSVRNVPTQEKDEAYSAYGIASHVTGQYEVDHLISLELGGSNDIANLWPEPANPRPGFHEKDKVENYLHEQVCAGAIPLRQAQQEIATNWLAVYAAMSGTAGTVARIPTVELPTAAAPTAMKESASPVGHSYYASAYPSAHTYYCDDDPAWQKLSPRYLVHLDSEAEVHARFPSYTIHHPC